MLISFYRNVLDESLIFLIIISIDIGFDKISDSAITNILIENSHESNDFFWDYKIISKLNLIISPVIATYLLSKNLLLPFIISISVFLVIYLLICNNYFNVCISFERKKHSKLDNQYLNYYLYYIFTYNSYVWVLPTLLPMSVLTKGVSDMNYSLIEMSITIFSMLYLMIRKSKYNGFSLNKIYLPTMIFFLLWSQLSVALVIIVTIIMFIFSLEFNKHNFEILKQIPEAERNNVVFNSKNIAYIVQTILLIIITFSFSLNTVMYACIIGGLFSFLGYIYYKKLNLMVV